MGTKCVSLQGQPLGGGGGGGGGPVSNQSWYRPDYTKLESYTSSLTLNTD